MSSDPERPNPLADIQDALAAAKRANDGVAPASLALSPPPVLPHAPADVHFSRRVVQVHAKGQYYPPATRRKAWGIVDGAKDVTGTMIEIDLGVAIVLLPRSASLDDRDLTRILNQVKEDTERHRRE